MMLMTVRRAFSLAVLAVAATPWSAAAQPPAPAPAASVPTPPRAAWFARYQDDRSGPESTETVTRTFKVGAGGSLDIFNIAGTVVVSGTPGSEIVVNAVKRVRGRSGDARALLDGIVIDSSETAGRVEVRTMVRRPKYTNAWVDYTVQVPFSAAVSARSLSGDVKVTGVKGDVQIESTSGTAEARDTPSLVRVKTISGDILVTDAGAAGALSASTVSGRLVARGLKARSLELTSISGDLVLLHVACERSQVRTVSGEVEFMGPLARGGRYEFVSHSGDVRLRVTPSSGFELSARTFSGEVRSEVPVSLSSPDADLPEGIPHAKDVRGTFGDGSALVMVKTFSGSVVLAKAEQETPQGRSKPDKKAPRN